MKARIGAGFMIWLAAVVSVAGIAWLAIGTAGKQVTADPIAAPLPTEFPPSPSPTRTTATLRTTDVDDVSPTSTKVGPAPGRTSRPVTTTTGSREEPERRGERPRPRFSPVTSSYSTPSGRLRVRCDGQRITLDGGYAQPAPGWAVTVQSGGPDRIQVTFDTDKSAPVSVVAECGQGRPRFRLGTAPAAPAVPSAPTPTAGGGWRPQFRTPVATPVTPPITATTSPACAVAPSPTATPSATPAPGATPTPTPVPSVTPACPQVEASVTAPATAPATVPATPAAAPDESWAAREWAARTRS